MRVLVALHQGAGAVGRAVVGDDHLPLAGPALARQGFELVPERGLRIEARDHDAQLAEGVHEGVMIADGYGGGAI